MMFKEDTISRIKDAIKHAVSFYVSPDIEFVHTDIYIQADRFIGQLIFSNDEEIELCSVCVEELKSYSLDGYYELLEYELRSILEDMYYESAFNDVKISTPYSFVLVDDNKEVLSDILFVDNDTIVLNDGLLKGLDKELDEFFRKLLES